MKTIQMKTGYAIYDAPPALKKFLEVRASCSASKELLTQLSADAMAEQDRECREPGAVVIQLDRARLARSQFAPTGQIVQLPSEIAPEAS
jgi:hypothetical protein